MRLQKSSNKITIHAHAHAKQDPRLATAETSGPFGMAS
jgi:hypothetical protein